MCSRSSLGPQLCLVALATMSDRLAAVACRPRAERRSSRGVVIVLVEQSVVVGERVRGDAQLPDTRVIREDDVQRWWLLATAGALVQHVGDGLGGHGAPGEGLPESGVQFSWAMALEQPTSWEV